ncbi:MAG: putative rane protein [Hyphomicrobiales bacterium]|nr:putative rane protein [Hyphomicrobiales bacterium]
MSEYLTGIALLILVITGVGVFKVLRARPAVERMMAIQLLGTGGAAATLLLSAASASPAIADMSLLLVLFAAFSCSAFALGHFVPAPDTSSEAEDRR